MAQNLDPSQFGKPFGPQGEEVGRLMAEGNKRINLWTIRLMGNMANQSILEIGFGPGIAVEELIRLSQANFVAGIDHSEVMLAQASLRNSDAIDDGRVELKLGSVSSLPYHDNFFDTVFSVNCFHFWPEPMANLTEIQRVLKPNGLVAITIQPRWATSEEMVDEVGDDILQWLDKIGFGSTRLEKKEFDPMSAVCAIGIKN